MHPVSGTHTPSNCQKEKENNTDNVILLQNIAELLLDLEEVSDLFQAERNQILLQTTIL